MTNYPQRRSPQRSGPQRRRRKSNLTAWVIEFSKKVVVLCVVIHVVAFVYSAVAMWKFTDISALSTIISESSEVLRTCVFGYMIKAGLENWQKIKNSKSNTEGQNENETEEPKG